jgi:hypothetical protein
MTMIAMVVHRAVAAAQDPEADVQAQAGVATREVQPHPQEADAVVLLEAGPQVPIVQEMHQAVNQAQKAVREKVNLHLKNNR